MISARTVKEAEGYTVDAYTYSPDISATGEELTMYEVYNNNGDMLEAFEELEEAVNFMKNQIVWEKLINSLPLHPQIVA